MPDRLTPKQRSNCMARIAAKDTKPEWVVRRAVWALGYRYRLHRKALPGHPDLVFAKQRKVIFVHGCFWHRHTCRRGRSTPGSNVAFWNAKLEGNAARDRRTTAELRRQGWRVLVVWECQVKDIRRLARRISAFLEVKGEGQTTPAAKQSKPRLRQRHR